MSSIPAARPRGGNGDEAGAAIARRRLRLAVFAPVPPAASGIADYVADLLPLLPERWEIEVYTDGDPPDEPVGGRAPCRSVAAWDETGGADAFDLLVHQVGNDIELVGPMERARRHPGLLVLHDPVVHPARAGDAIHRGHIHAYRRALERIRPDISHLLGHLVASGTAGASLFWRFPMCEDLVRASRLTAVHGDLLAEWLRAMVPEADVASVAHWRSVRIPSEQEAAAWRRRLGATDTPLLASFGHIGPAHRLHVVLEALSRLVDRHPFRLAVVGSLDDQLDLRDRARRLGLEERVHWLGRVDAADFGALMGIADVAFNLRYPTARASSGTLQQLLQLGTPVVVSDLVHLRELPDAAVLRVPPGETGEEAETLARALLPWLRDPEHRAAAGRAARSWAAREITPERMADSYFDAVARALAT